MFVLRNRYFLLIDLILSICSVVLSFMLRLETIELTDRRWLAIIFFLSLAIPIRLGIFLIYGMYSRYWINAGPGELMLCISTCFMSGVIITILSLVLVRVFGLESELPRSIPVIDTLIITPLVLNARFSMRAYYHQRNHRSGRQATDARKIWRQTLIIGADHTGVQVLDVLAQAADHVVRGFLDDDPHKQGTYVRGLKVLGKIDQLTATVGAYHIDLVIIALSMAPGGLIRQIVSDCLNVGVAYKIIPGMHELVSGKISISALRPVAIDDLLRRSPVSLDLSDIEQQIRGRRILVTGAGGSIGGELTRQIARHQPDQLLLVGHGENSLFATENRLRSEFPTIPIQVMLTDIRNLPRMTLIFEQWRPQMVFHAAAHKHVPMLESNAAEAVTNNVLGTQNLISLCNQFEVQRMVMISTDKAVKPTNVMGLTKRVTELTVMCAAHEQPQRFAAVRFGNVLGSRGSVIPIFQEQIAVCGPLTLTSDKMTRYFMSIPEASLLVLKASALVGGGPLFVLNMGEPVRVLDLAHDLIRLNGLEPDRAIEIKITGLRPGERMHEEFCWDYETSLPIENGLVFSIQLPELHSHTLVAELTGQVQALIQAARSYDEDKTKGLLQEIVFGWPHLNKVEIDAVGIDGAKQSASVTSLI